VLREQTQGMGLRDIVETVLAHSGLIEHYQAEREGADRVENLQELVSAAESFVSVEGFGRDAVALPVDMDTGEAAETGETLSPLAAFLTHAALESGENQALAGAEAIQMMTVHAAKGLEFDAVFITGLEEGLFPHENSLSDHQGLEEERRLMYVAITRARKRLYLSHAQTRMLHGQTRYNIRSRFFDELPEHTLKWLSLATPGLNPASAWGSSRQHATAAASTDWTAAISPQPTASVSGASAWIQAGVQVFHNKFGEGVVMAIEGSGDDARAQVKFGRHGIKWLALSVAKLTPV